MDEYTILGKKDLDYINKQGRPVKGINLFCTTHDANVIGQKTEALYVSTASDCYQKCLKLDIGTTILVSYNRYGQIADVTAKIDK